ncbi:MAG TPA: SPOR domain-containing protein [Steroidobacteraceae bacterium]|jgi:cell division protein FtsN|nr:SPOR domain-containing protein [Steroidobacteraceae bacterium]
MIMNKAAIGLCIALLLGIGGCSRQQSDWEKTRAANTTDSYEQFLKKYPSGEFTAQAQARVKELYEERDWQKARDTDTQEAYQAFLKQYPEGKWTEEARIRVENFTLAQAPSNATPAGVDTANTPATPVHGATPVPGAAPAPSAPPAAKTPPAAPPAAAAPPVKTAAAVGSYGIQLGAFKTSAAANHRWTHVDQEYATLLAGLSPTVTPKKGASGTLHRLQVAGLTETHARAICKSLQAKGQPCVVLHPGAH